MLQRRTDLALEARDMWAESAKEGAALDGVEAAQSERGGCPVTTIRVTSPEGARALGKPEGVYVTLELDGLRQREKNALFRCARALADELRPLLRLNAGDCVLVAGLGNRAITPDCIGPAAVRHTLVTRHLVEQLPEQFGRFRPVAALAAGVLGDTGVESSELVRAMAEKLRPACVIAIDALASRSLDRLCRTVQLTDTGITPGSGVGNHRAALDRAALGVPVIAVGAPTVVDAGTLCADVLSQAGADVPEPDALRRAAAVMVTPRDIDQSAADLAKVIGYGVTLALQDGLTPEDLEMFLD